MKALKIINIIIGGLTLLILLLLVLSYIAPDIYQNRKTPISVIHNLHKTAQIKSVSKNLINENSSNSTAVSAEALSKIFSKIEAAPAESPVKNIIKAPSPILQEPEIAYDTTRLDYLGFTVSDSAETENSVKKYLIKDNRYDDVFGISENEEVFGFLIIEISEEDRSLVLQNEDEFFRIDLTK